MNETSNPPSLLGQALLEAIREAVKYARSESNRRMKGRMAYERSNF